MDFFYACDQEFSLQDHLDMESLIFATCEYQVHHPSVFTFLQSILLWWEQFLGQYEEYSLINEMHLLRKNQTSYESFRRINLALDLMVYVYEVITINNP